MESDGYWSQSYTTNFPGALTLDAHLSFPNVKDRRVCVSSDATMTQFAAVDYTARVGTVLSFHFRPHLLFCNNGDAAWRFYTRRYFRIPESRPFFSSPSVSMNIVEFCWPLSVQMRMRFRLLIAVSR